MKEMADIQTRLKTAMLALLDEKHFEQITVTDLCAKAKTSRVTFYTYYDDKYALLDDYFAEMQAVATARFEALQTMNNPQDDPCTGYCDLLDTIMDLYYSHYDFFRHAERESDQSLYFRYYWHVLRHVELFTLRYCERLRPAFSPEETSSLLCNGLWGYIHTCRGEKRPVEDIRAGAKEMLQILLHSALFLPVAPGAE